ncbi:MAG TPA: hypothetical protein VN442_17735 [Bryobacteraceae bacterium]|nr:hypothetical protein [Bryobacteraceae bacterium]
MAETDLAGVVRQVVQEFAEQQQAKSEPAYKAELVEERKRREELERRMNALVEENRRARQQASEIERGAAIRAELQRLGVAKVDLAYKAVQDGVVRTDDGRLVARTETGEVGLKDFLTGFVAENPEFLPARMAGGTGMTATQKASGGSREGVDLDKIRPGMSKEDMERVRQEILRVTAQTLGNV